MILLGMTYDLRTDHALSWTILLKSAICVTVLRWKEENQSIAEAPREDIESFNAQ